MDLDELMDLPNRAVEDVFGRTVTYTPNGGTPIEVQPNGDFQERYEELTAEGMMLPVSGRLSAIDFRTATLEEAGIQPRQGDTLELSLRGVVRRFGVHDVRAPSSESTLIVLNARSAP